MTATLADFKYHGDGLRTYKVIASHGLQSYFEKFAIIDVAMERELISV